MTGDNLVSWSLKRALRVLAGLAVLFGAFVVIGLLTRASFSPEHSDFPSLVILYWLITLPLALLYLAVAVASEGLRRISLTKTGK